MNASGTNSRGGVDDPDNPVAITTIVVSETGSWRTIVLYPGMLPLWPIQPPWHTIASP